MGKPNLYSYFRSSCSYRVRISLALKEIDHSIIPINLSKGSAEQNKSEYSLKNPKSEVPLWEENRQHLAQSMAILLYLEEKYPKPSLFPEDIWKKALCLELCEIINSGIQPLQNLKVLNFVSQIYKKDGIKEVWAKYWINDGLKAFEQRWKVIRHSHFAHGQWALGNEITMVDIFLIPQIYNAHRFGIKAEEFPELFEIYEKAQEHPAFHQAFPSNQIDFPKTT